MPSVIFLMKLFPWSETYNIVWSGLSANPAGWLNVAVKAAPPACPLMPGPAKVVTMPVLEIFLITLFDASAIYTLTFLAITIALGL